MLDDFKDNKGKKIFLLIPIMLLWSNLHGGFIIGIIIIVVFMLGKGINIFLKKGTHTKKEIFLFYSAAVLAIAASFVNPTGWDAFSVAINIPFKYKAIHVDVQEYQSLLFYYRNKIYPIHYGYVFLALMFPIVVMLRNKNMAFTHLMLLAGFL